MMVIHHMNKLIDLGFYLSFYPQHQIGHGGGLLLERTFNSLNTLIVL